MSSLANVLRCCNLLSRLKSVSTHFSGSYPRTCLSMALAFFLYSFSALVTAAIILWILSINLVYCTCLASTHVPSLTKPSPASCSTRCLHVCRCGHSLPYPVPCFYPFGRLLRWHALSPSLRLGWKFLYCGWHPTLPPRDYYQSAASTVS